MKAMKFNTVHLMLLLAITILFGLAFASPEPIATDDFEACVVDDNGKPLIYVVVKDLAGNWLAETDVHGCFRMKGDEVADMVELSFPGYESQQLSLRSGSEGLITLSRIQYLPAVHLPEKGTIYPTESRGDYQIKGQVLDSAKEPLIGANVLIAGTTKGTTANIDGYFVLSAPRECVDLIITYTGFKTLEQKNTCVGKEHTFYMEVPTRWEALMDSAVSGEKRLEGGAVRTLSVGEPISDYAVSAPPPPSVVSPKSVGRTTMAMDVTPTDFSRARRVEPDYATIPASADAPAGGAMPEGVIEELPKAGQLTAGEVNDFSKWEMWSDISQEDLAMHRGTWKQYADHRYTLQLTTPEGSAVINATATLKDGQGNALWQARTDAQGRAELWAHYFREVATAANGLSIEVEYGRKKVSIPNAKPFRAGINFQTLGVDCREDAVVDVAFVVDATGSMGDEISYLQAELLDVIGRVKEGLPGVDLEMGSVFYRDEGEEYLTRLQPFTASATEAMKFMEQQQAMGGGDYPEAVEVAMESALDSLPWRDDASTRLLFLVLDAPPHQAEENIKRMQVAVTKAAMRGIQIIPVSCSGVDKSTEYLLRSMALATNGTYTFVTDHSGIGNAHIEPSTDSYEVEYLNDVLARLIIERSQLSTCDTPVAEVGLLETPTPTARNWAYYPNPTSGPLSLRFPDTEGTLYLADAHGKLLLQRPANEDFDMNLSAYPAGTYWLRHESAEGEWTQGQVLLLRR
ncbi:MAG: carboxypeptidase-like regulatory domain-containing protein [Bacteroidota bacterium]